MRLRFTPTARKQFLSAVAYIHQDKLLAAINFRQKVEQGRKRLEMYPSSGRKLSEFPDLPFREVIISPYRFFYRVKGKTVWVVAAWHVAQVPTEPHGGGGT